MRSVAAIRAQVEAALGPGFPSPFTFCDARAPEMVPSGIPEFDALTGGLPRGSLTEIFGPPSSGRTSLMLSMLAEMTGRQEACALVDPCDALDPCSAAAAGVEMERLLWIRCRPPRPVEQALTVTDLLLGGGGFGLVVVDLADVPPRTARRVSLSSWFRFRRVVENTPTALVVLDQTPCAKSCASLVLRLESHRVHWSAAGNPGRRDSAFGARGSSSKIEFRNSELQRHSLRAGFSNEQRTTNHGALGYIPSHACLLRGARLQVEVVRNRCSTAENQNSKIGTRIVLSSF